MCLLLLLLINSYLYQAKYSQQPSTIYIKLYIRLLPLWESEVTMLVVRKGYTSHSERKKENLKSERLNANFITGL